MENKHATINGVRVSYGEGPSNGPRLVVAGGYPSAWTDYALFLEELESRYHVFAATMRGVSPSEHRPPYTIADWTTDLGAFVHHVAQGPVLGIGHSAGAWFGLASSAKDPDLLRAFVSIDQPLDPRAHIGFNRERIPLLAGIAYALRSVSTIEELAHRMADLPSSDGGRLGDQLSEEQLEHEAASWRSMDPELFRAWEDDQLEHLLLVPELLDLPGAYNGPVLFLYGDPQAGSLVTPEAREYNRARYRRARNVQVDGLDHGMRLSTEPAPVVHEIDRFFGAIDG